MKYPTSYLIFQNTHEPLGECVYGEKSSHEWDISQCATKATQLCFNKMPLFLNSLQNEIAFFQRRPVSMQQNRLLNSA